MRRLQVLVPLLVAALAGGCTKKVVVGVVLPETGAASAYGSSIRSGVKLAFDDAVAAGTAPKGLEVIYRDSGSDPARAAKETDAIFKQGALIVIGGATSPEAKASIPIAEKDQGILLSPSASEPGLAKASNLFFRIYPSDDVEGVEAADFLYTSKQAKTILVLVEDNQYTRGLLPIFEKEYSKLGGKILSTIKIGETGWEKQFADQLKADKPDGLYICGYGEAILATLLEARNDKFEGTICTTSAISTVDLVWRGGKLVEGVYFPMIRLDISSQQEPIKTFVKRYKEMNNNLAPDNYAAHGYDAALIVLAVLKPPIPDKATDLLPRLLGLTDLRGVTGKLAFDQYGDVAHRLRIHCIKNGKVEDCDPNPID